MVEGGVRIDKTVGCFNCTCGHIKAGWLQFAYTGRWDDLIEVCTPALLKQNLIELSDKGELLEAPPVAGQPWGYTVAEFEDLCRAYVPLGLSGVFTIAGIDTAANSYPNYDEVALDKLGNPLTLSIGPHATAFDILTAMVAVSNLAFDGFPHHCFPEGLDIDPVARMLYFSMGS
jgi:hypothetical protein